MPFDGSLGILPFLTWSQQCFGPSCVNPPLTVPEDPVDRRAAVSVLAEPPALLRVPNFEPGI